MPSPPAPRQGNEDIARVHELEPNPLAGEVEAQLRRDYPEFRGLNQIEHEGKMGECMGGGPKALQARKSSPLVPVSKLP